MKYRNTWLFKSLALIASPALIFVASATYAQDAVESETVVAVESDAAQEESKVSVEEVVVTGSRLKRSTFTSISPLQVITADISREAGLANAADILQTSTSAQGQQIDLTFSGFV